MNECGSRLIIKQRISKMEAEPWKKTCSTWKENMRNSLRGIDNKVRSKIYLI